MGRNEMKCVMKLCLSKFHIYLYSSYCYIFFLYIFSIFTLLSLSETNLFPSPTVNDILRKTSSFWFSFYMTVGICFGGVSFLLFCLFSCLPHHCFVLLFLILDFNMFLDVYPVTRCFL